MMSTCRPHTSGILNGSQHRLISNITLCNEIMFISLFPRPVSITSSNSVNSSCVNMEQCIPSARSTRAVSLFFVKRVLNVGICKMKCKGGLAGR